MHWSASGARATDGLVTEIHALGRKIGDRVIPDHCDAIAILVRAQIDEGTTGPGAAAEHDTGRAPQNQKIRDKCS